jgi:hypothetical protein
MKTALMVLVVLAMLATLGVLFAGLLGLARNADGARQNKLMQARVGLQLVALVLFGALLLIAKA